VQPGEVRTPIGIVGHDLAVEHGRFDWEVRDGRKALGEVVSIAAIELNFPCAASLAVSAIFQMAFIRQYLHRSAERLRCAQAGGIFCWVFELTVAWFRPLPHY
jgi:hypothetical protein